MKKILIGLFFIALTTTSFAANIDFPSHFGGKPGCFILFDMKQDKIVTEYNKQRCAQRISPGSTFKIPLSLMVFDQKLIDQKTVFKWDGQDRGGVWYKSWNQDQTPRTWMQNSVVWVSQSLTPKLGMEKITDYLAKFHYGNQDFSGEAGKNNGLMRAWLGDGSLKISANEQLAFLKAWLIGKLPVSSEATEDTLHNIALGTTPHGWQWYGKTGTSITKDKAAKDPEDSGIIEDSWFVGTLQKADQRYLFVLNVTNHDKVDIPEWNGAKAKKITQEILTQMDLF